MRNGRTMEDNERPWKNIEPLGPDRPLRVVQPSPMPEEKSTELPEESRIALDTTNLEQIIRDPLYHMAAALRALTWEQMNELCQGAHCQPDKLISWARVKQGEPEVIEPNKPAGRRM